MLLRGKSVRSWCDGSTDRSFIDYFFWGVRNRVVKDAL